MSKRKYDYREIYLAAKNGMSRNELKEMYGIPANTLATIITMGDVFTGLAKNEQPLSKFTPRQLMEELASRGYTGQLKYTQTIDLGRI